MSMTMAEAHRQISQIREYLCKIGHDGRTEIIAAVEVAMRSMEREMQSETAASLHSGDLISRLALLEEVRRCKEAVGKCANHDYIVGYAAALSGVEGQIAAAPTVDAEPVRHGRWIPQDVTFTRFMCSACKSRNHAYRTDYCPNCGAKTDEKVNFTAPDDDMLGYRDTVWEVQQNE